MASKTAKTAQEILMADFQALVRDTEKLLADTANLAGDQADELREQIHDRLTQARETLQLTQDSVRERGQAALGSAEQYVQNLSLIHISEPTRPRFGSRMPSSA